MAVIETENLTKTFNGTIRAVDQINLTVEKKEIFGFLGPNGAGKTTTINMLCTLLKPTSGRATVAGYDILKEQDKVRKSIGLVFQDPSLDERLTGRENLDFHARLYHIPPAEKKQRIKDLLDLVELSERADDLVKTYSGGMRRRLEIARGLIHYPQVLFLDEPTLGLDPQTRVRIWDYIQNLNKTEDITIFLTTHYMDEADHLCERLAIIDHGKIIARGTPDELKNHLGGDVIELEIENGLQELIEALKITHLAKYIKQKDGEISLTVQEGTKMIPKVLELATSVGTEVTSVDLHRPTLDDVFLHHTGRRIREEETGVMDRMRMYARAWRRRRG